jgi:hypothetical protein
MRQVSLEDALRLVHLYGEKESPKYERAALRWLERYLTESSPSLQSFASVVAVLPSAPKANSLPACRRGAGLRRCPRSESPPKRTLALVTFETD